MKAYTYNFHIGEGGLHIQFSHGVKNAIINAYELEIEPSGCLHWKLKSSKTVIITIKSTKSSGNLLLYGIYSVKMF